MFAHRSGSSVSSSSYCSRSDLARKKMIPATTMRKPATEAIAMPTTSGSETYSSQCSPRYHQFSPTRHLQQRSEVQLHRYTKSNKYCMRSSDLQMAPLPGMMSHWPSLRQKLVCTSQMLWHGRPSTLRYPASQTHSASPDHRFTIQRENSLHAWNLQGSARSPGEETTRRNRGRRVRGQGWRIEGCSRQH